MDLLSVFKRQGAPQAPAAAAPQAVLMARSRARRRLIGATLLLAVGVIGFPLLFENQPRPIPVDINIEIPRKDNAPPLVLPPLRPASAAVAARLALPTEPVPEAARPEATPQGPAPSVAAPAPNKPVDDGARAQALLEGKSNAAAKPSAGPSMSAAMSAANPASAPSEARLVVQVGAYTEADKLREARQKVERLGMTTYIQVIEADGGRRTRVRVGPFATRDEALKAAERIKAAGLPASILAL